MRPRNFQVAVALRLGLPVLEEEKSCSLCMQTIDVFGDHAACCAVSSHHRVEHAFMRDFVQQVAHTVVTMDSIKRRAFLVMLVGDGLEMSQFQFGEQTKA